MLKKHYEGPSLSVEQSAAPPWGVASAASVLVVAVCRYPVLVLLPATFLSLCPSNIEYIHQNTQVNIFRIFASRFRFRFFVKPQDIFISEQRRVITLIT